MSTQSVPLNEVQRSRLIELVRPHSFLYNMADKVYRDVNKKQEVWQSVANAMEMPGLTAGEVAKKWKSLVDTYRKNMQKSKKSTGSAKSSDVRWAHFDAMNFMEKFLDGGETSSNLDETAPPAQSQADLFAQPSDSNDSQEKEKEVLVDVKEFSTPPTAKKLKRSMDPVEEKLVALIEVAQKQELARANAPPPPPKTEKELFGELVARKVKDLDDDLFSDLELEVLELIRTKTKLQEQRNNTVHNYLMEEDRYTVTNLY
ncbi:transcription factor Adf-1-like protein [Aphelenchoides avenae]|nr:transcription factor Adf-1-like protein [Aphelenchus avenae]